jgi:hypothetical protein
MENREMYDKFLIRITTEMVELKTRVYTLEQTNKNLRDALEARGQQDSTLVTPPAPQAKKPRGRPPGAKNKPKDVSKIERDFGL